MRNNYVESNTQRNKKIKKYERVRPRVKGEQSNTYINGLSDRDKKKKMRRKKQKQLDYQVISVYCINKETNTWIIRKEALQRKVMIICHKQSL